MSVTAGSVRSVVFCVQFYADYVDGCAGYGLCQNPGSIVGVGVRKATISITIYFS